MNKLFVFRIDVDAELAKIDGEETETKKKKKTNVLRKPRKPEVEEEVSATGRVHSG